jgi:hypothetical protein
MACQSTRPLFVAAGCVAMVLMSTVGCRSREIIPERLPGTERLSPESPTWFSISPDEAFAIFAEVDSSYPPPPADYKLAPDFHLVTLDLRSGTKTHHHLDDLPPQTLASVDPGSWYGLMRFFDANGWSEGVFFVECWISPVASINPWIAFAAHTPAAARVPPPDAVGCSDCPPSDAVLRMAKSRGIDTLVPNSLSAAYHGGRLSEYLYTDAPRGDGIELVRVDSRGEKKVIKRVSRFGKEVMVNSIRVSPDERYLAYSVDFRLKLPFPTPAVGELYVYDLAKRRTRRIDGVYAGISNLIWSPDSRRLYFGARDGRTNGLYRATIENRR